MHKCQFSKLESHLQISRHVNGKLNEKGINLELKCHANKQYSRRECLEISNILPDIADQDTENKLLEILDAIDFPVGSSLVDDCYRIDARQVLLNKKKIQELKLESINLRAGLNIYVNESLCLNYKKL